MMSDWVFSMYLAILKYDANVKDLYAVLKKDSSINQDYLVHHPSKKTKPKCITLQKYVDSLNK